MTDERRPDLVTRSAVHDLVVEFYRAIVHDDLLGPLFDDVAEVDWSEHIPTLVDYWSRILLEERSPRRPITVQHRHLHALEPIRVIHCDRWWQLWCESVDSNWAGPSSQRAKRHGRAMMRGMARHLFGLEWPSAPLPEPWPEDRSATPMALSSSGDGVEASDLGHSSAHGRN